MRNSTKSSPKKLSETLTSPMSLSNSKMCIKVFSVHEPAMYWTVPLENYFTVAHVCETICNKLGGDDVLGYILIRRTKRKLFQTSKDVVLHKDSLISDIDNKMRKKNKNYTLLIQAINSATGNAPPPELDCSQTTTLPVPKDIKGPMQPESPRDTVPTPRLKSSPSAPNIQAYIPPSSSPVFLLNSPSPDRNEQVLLLFGKGEVESTTFMTEERRKTQEHIEGCEVFIDATSPMPTIGEDLQIPSPGRESPRSKVNDVEVIRKPVYLAPTSPPSLVERGSGGLDRRKTHSDHGGRERKRGSAVRKRDSYGPGGEKDTPTIVRLYPTDDGNVDGRCWTIAVTSLHTAADVCYCIEQRLSLAPQSLKLCVVYNTPGGGRTEHQLGDDESIIRGKSFLPGATPFFFLRERQSLCSVKDIALPSKAPPKLIPPGFKRTNSSGSIAKSPFAQINAKRCSLPIFLCDNISGSSSSSDDTDSPEPLDITALDSEHWSSEHSSHKHEASILSTHVNWIKSEDITKFDKIGEGSFAKVYRGSYNENLVAIKTLKGVATEDQLASFKKEFEVLSVISSPYLIRFYGASIRESESAPLLSMVFSYCEKGSLYGALNNKKLDFNWQILFKWTHQALNGVNYLHSISPPLVHRDLKTHNLLLDGKWNIKVADFGLARSLTMSHASSLGNLRGTMAYCAPEIYDGQLFSGKSDVFSMAIVIWEMINRCITGKYRAPYNEYPEIQHPFQLIIKTSKSGLRPTIHPKTPPLLQDLLVRCWDPKPEVRPTSAELIVIVQNIYLTYQLNAEEWEKLREKPVEIDITR